MSRVDTPRARRYHSRLHEAAPLTILFHDLHCRMHAYMPTQHARQSTLRRTSLFCVAILDPSIASMTNCRSWLWAASE